MSYREEPAPSSDAAPPLGLGARTVGGWPPRRQAKWALLLLLLAYILAFIDRIIMSILIRPVSAELGMNDVQFALVGGVAFSVFYVTMGLPIGWLVDRFSRRLIVSAGIAIWSLCTLLSGLAPSFGWLFLARVGVGIGEAALSPAAYSLIADYFPPEKRGRAVAIYTLGVSLGSSAAYLVGGALMNFAGQHGGIDLPVLGELTPWRFVFAAVGLPGLLLAALTFTLREPARRAADPGVKEQPGKLWAFLRANQKVSVTYILGYSLINLPFAGFLLWGPALFDRVHGMGPAALALPLALIFLIPTTLGQWFGAVWTDRGHAAGHGDAAFRTAAACALLLTPVAIAMPLVGNAVAALICLAILVFLVCASVGHHAVVAAAVAPNRLRGMYIALFFFFQNVLGQAVIAVVTALLTNHVFGSPDSIGKSMAIIGGLGAIGGFFTLQIGRKGLRDLSRSAPVPGT